PGPVDALACSNRNTSDPGNRPVAVACAASGLPGTDQCMTDDDCAAGTACGCATQFRGNAIHTNTCVQAQCRVDSDCGPGGTCSPSESGYCSSLTGYFCHKPTDTCVTDAD